MQTEPAVQYRYFLKLENMVKLALSVYGAVLVTGILWISLGVDSFFAEVASGKVRSLILTVFGICGIALGTFALVEKIRWVSKLNVWLDRKLFKILDQSNRILFDAIFESSDVDPLRFTILADDTSKQMFAQHVFRRLSGEDQMFQFLLNSNIFRLWIWYWIFLYGSFTFTLLTAGIFISAVLGITILTKIVFGSLWLLAFLHIALGFFLGNKLVRATRSAATAIFDSYRGEITTLVGESISEFQHSVNK